MTGRIVATSAPDGDEQRSIAARGLRDEHRLPEHVLEDVLRERRPGPSLRGYRAAMEEAETVGVGGGEVEVMCDDDGAAAVRDVARDPHHALLVVEVEGRGRLVEQEQ